MIAFLGALPLWGKLAAVGAVAVLVTGAVVALRVDAYNDGAADRDAHWRAEIAAANEEARARAAAAQRQASEGAAVLVDTERRRAAELEAGLAATRAALARARAAGDRCLAETVPKEAWDALRSATGAGPAADRVQQ